MEGHLTHKLIHIIETVMVYSSGVHADGDCFFLLCKSGKSENLSHAGKWFKALQLKNTHTHTHFSTDRKKQGKLHSSSSNVFGVNWLNQYLLFWESSVSSTWKPFLAQCELRRLPDFPSAGISINKHVNTSLHISYWHVK